MSRSSIGETRTNWPRVFTRFAMILAWFALCGVGGAAVAHGLLSFFGLWAFLPFPAAAIYVAWYIAKRSVNEHVKEPAP